MKAFVWERLDYVTYSYHGEGGLLIIADDLDAARAFWVRENAKQEAAMKWKSDAPLSAKSDVLTSAPDLTLTLADAVEPKMVVFPDAGCC